ncbi:MAG: response regulator, partial [Hydrogenibacillus schlegelii]|nr:response regulator [Hydrogenibacillus schlegelii]
ASAVKAPADDVRVLIVEDDPMVAEVNRQMLVRLSGFRLAGTAGDARTAERFLAAASVDLVLLDLYLPGDGGLTLFEAIRRRGGSTDVIVISAANETEAVRRALALGAIDYLIKPFTFARFAAALRRYRALRRLKEVETVDQATLDRLRFAPWAAEAELGAAVDPTVEPDLPKGLNAETLRRVRTYLAGASGSVTAEDVADGIGASRVTARRYLDYLVERGEVELDFRYGAVGRPRHRYRLRWP